MPGLNVNQNPSLKGNKAKSTNRAFAGMEKRSAEKPEGALEVSAARKQNTVAGKKESKSSRQKPAKM